MRINNDLRKVLGEGSYTMYKNYIRCINAGDLAGAAEEAEAFEKWRGESLYKYIERR